ncbi:hypothetical protein [Fodinicola feengrottensis]|uniref:hypothetical protein n=1 Tax=Fodinicola feengrottensis TaxID=435914 RepID=UPI002443211A|nr:hypothetical protein [Fodinicola feengrottensis]
MQGYSPTSCWSRGQAWGIYGFTTMYRRTGYPEFLATARKLADFALSVLTPDHVPVWDYRAPQAPHDIKDASAGAVMACGLLDLARVSRRPIYQTRALDILTALCRTCLTTTSTRADAIVARCTRNRPSEDGVEISVPYGDYYLLERRCCASFAPPSWPPRSDFSRYSPRGRRATVPVLKDQERWIRLPIRQAASWRPAGRR